MPQASQSVEINEDKMNAFLGKVVGDFGASLGSVLGYIGIKLGLFQALADSDGVTPAEGIVLYVYHTDATGYYNKDDDPYNPRLRGWMKTGKDGRYEF